MTRLLVAVVYAVSAATVANAFPPSLARVSTSFGETGALQSTTDHAECSHLTMLRLPDVKISEAVSVPAATTGTVRAPHCRVNGVIGSEIRFSLLLPDTWNKKFFMGGGGGFVGSVQNSAAPTVNLGYATVGTDTGHQGIGTDASWALNNPERLLNFGYLAIHRTAEVAKAIIRSYYGGESSRSYFSGCSRGGGQALMEAQRFPDDFDGIVAGAPAYDWTGIAAQMIHHIRAAIPDSQAIMTPLFTPEELRMIESKILDACDANDGVKDRVLDDPRPCRFNVDALPLTEPQRAALKSLYAPTLGPDGTEIYPPQPFGGEGEPAGWAAWITGPNPLLAAQKIPSLQYAFGTGMLKYLIFNDASFDYTKYDLKSWKKDSARAATILNATNPDLDAFKAKGRKLILWHGWADAALTPLASIRYFEQVKTRDANASDYFRMFLLPGVLHCGGGPGPDTADWNAAIADWVENGKAPDRVVAKKTVSGQVTRTRPLCVYPQKAVYKGTGSTDHEGNFACR